MARVMIVDASPLIYSVFNTQVGTFCNSKGELTGVRYGVIRAVRSWAQKLKTNNAILAFDLKGKVLKAETLGETYKTGREWTPEKQKMYDQIPALREMLDLTGYTQVDAEGYEADDLIGHLTRKLRKDGHTIFIYTTDNDMMQLLGDEVTIFVPGTNWAYIGPQEVRNKYGVWPEHLLLYRAAVGDTSDTVKGIGLNGNQKISLVKFLGALPKKEWTTDEFYDTLDQCMDKGLVTKLLEERPTFERNWLVMSLHSPPKLNIRKGRKDTAALETLFQELEFKSLMRFIPDFTR